MFAVRRDQRLSRARRGTCWSLGLAGVWVEDRHDWGPDERCLPGEAGLTLREGFAGAAGGELRSPRLLPPTQVGRSEGLKSRPCSSPCPHTPSSGTPAGWRLEILEPLKNATVRAGSQALFTCTLSEVVPVGEASWYINGAAVQPDDADWTVTADGSHHALLLRSAQLLHAGEVTFACRDAVASARLTVLGGWWAGSFLPPLQVGSGARLASRAWGSVGDHPGLGSAASAHCRAWS